jgi:hypothetical protein
MTATSFPCERLRRTALPTLLVMLAALSAAAPAAARSGCDLGWYEVGGAALLAADGAPHARAAAAQSSAPGRVVSMVGDAVSIEGLCPRTTARVTHRRQRTKVQATWDSCGGVDGPVRLRAAIEGGSCDTMRGSLTAKRARPKRRRFVARRSLGNREDCSTEDTFITLQRRIFGPKGCRVASCHGEFKAGGLDLRYGAAHYALVDQPATAPGAAGQRRVVPGDPEGSFLWRKLMGDLKPEEGVRMPASGATPLGALELELVRTWIADGAPAVGRIAQTPCLPHPRFEPAAPLPPPPGGHQLVFEGPILQPGEEVEGCMWVRAPNTQPFTIGRWEYSLNPGSHHFAMWEHARGPEPVLGQFDAGDVACIKQGAPVDGVTLSGAPEAPYFAQAFPRGTGDTIEPGAILGLNPHYFNEFDVPIQLKAWINLHPVDGTFAHEAEALFSGAGSLDGKTVYSILVEPFTTGALKLRMTNTLDRPMRIFHMSSHQHQRGTRFVVWNAGGEKIFENFDWAHPAMLNFDPPYILAPGDHIDYQCDWDNGVTRPVRLCGDSQADDGCAPGEPVAVRFGVTAQDEMCYLVGFYYLD